MHDQRGDDAVLVEQPPYLCGPLIESDVGQGVGSPFEQSEDFIRPGLLSEDPCVRRADQRLTAVITRDALSELKLTRGDEALAIIKSTEVMVGREQPREAPRRRRRS